MSEILTGVWEALALWVCLWLSFAIAGNGWRRGRGDSHVINITFKKDD